MGAGKGKSRRASAARIAGSAAGGVVSGRIRKQKFLERMGTVSGGLGATQVEMLVEMAEAMVGPVEATANPDSDFADKRFVGAFGDILQMHHALSNESFTKDKLEFALERILQRLGKEAKLAPPGNPGHDLVAGGERWSVKTQADAQINRDSVMISKFMELGSGDWTDLGSLRDSMLEHMTHY